MDNSYSLNQRRQRPRDPLEKKMDQWFETGRQFVDGVAGNRPGQRNKVNVNRIKRQSVDNVGRWVGEKIDWFFEDEDDGWVESLEIENKSSQNLSNKKRPLRAISLRVPKLIAPESEFKKTGHLDGDWPEQSSYRIDRWQRSSRNTNEDLDSPYSKQARPSNNRPLPRSNRRRS